MPWKPAAPAGKREPRQIPAGFGAAKHKLGIWGGSVRWQIRPGCHWDPLGTLRGAGDTQDPPSRSQGCVAAPRCRQDPFSMGLGTPGHQQDPVPPSTGLGTPRTPSLSPGGCGSTPGTIETLCPPSVGLVAPRTPSLSPGGCDSSQVPAGPCAHPPWGWGPPGGLLQVRGLRPEVAAGSEPKGGSGLSPPVPPARGRPLLPIPGGKIPLIP